VAREHRVCWVTPNAGSASLSGCFTDVVRNQSERVTPAAGLVVTAGVLLLVGQVLPVVDFSTPCSPAAAVCGDGGNQPWFGLSMTQYTWGSGDPNAWALLFVAASLAAIAFGLVVLSLHRVPLFAAALTAILVVSALIANLVELSRFTSYWVHEACSTGACSVSTFDIGLWFTIAVSLFLVVALVFMSVVRSGYRRVQRPNETGVTIDSGSQPLPAADGSGESAVEGAP
jgi:hypothetical protein